MIGNKGTSVGALRLQSDMRQIGAMLMLLGFCAIIQPMGNIVSSVGYNGTNVKTPIQIASLIGSFCLFKIGVLALFIGYSQVVHDQSHKWVTAYAIVFTQTAFIPYITDMTNVGRTARDGEGFIPADYYPSQRDYNLVGAMIILGIISYGFTFVGSISFMQFSLYAYQAGKPEDRPASYYKGRMGFYCGMLVIAGASQFALGAYLTMQYDGGALTNGPIGGAMYLVNFPIISIVVGFVQIMNGLWGLARSVGFLFFFEDDYSYQGSIAFGWILQLSLQIFSQVGYLPGDMAAAAPAVIATLSFGLNLMPAYLDYKARDTPEMISKEYYCDLDTTEEQVEHKMEEA